MNIAIVGYGKMGRFYDNMLQARYLIEPRAVAGRVCFNNVEEFIAYKQPIELAIVATPTPTHFRISKQLLEAGYNVLVEKPLCLAASEAEELEMIADERGLLLYQSTLERYNPLVKFLKKNIPEETISHIESFRFGNKPPRAYLDDATFDLGIHDVDLWFHVYRREVLWRVNVGYGEPRREIVIHLRSGKKLSFDLLNRFITLNGHCLDFTKASANNPILEMMYDLLYKGNSMNERWSREIQILEQARGGRIELR